MTSTAAPFQPLRGRLKANVPLAPRSWFRTGGQADWLFVPQDEEDLATALQQSPPDMPLTVLGACSNIIIRDGGLAGLTLRLAGGFAQIEADGDGLIAGAAALDSSVAETAARAGMAGFAFLSTIPGSIGGAVRMNAGAYEGDMASLLDWVEILTREGTYQRLPAADLHMGYRHTTLPDGAIVLRARLKAQGAEDPALIQEAMHVMRAKREASQPLRARTGGSTFRNPEGHKAWELIDATGCRGLRHGGAQISEKHCNFMLNTGHATSTELEDLGEMVRARVLAQSGIELQWEIKRLGRLSHPA
ncbi:UDP-N-acetylmuramate dehydrogenase [Bombella saccharophila]|uniref:UDP-N-acetylenolpyruvoylglucosamine reductase n=1 Tax=Bombella saccharophila TaxID=2967338 RepID=A0ABT3W5L3_9PROT|nr:UDP-N-acetylmuramate dehydrogenase [Bombella saccharophila]MCX5614362.1 UDP-N-acetylmuramate dehydrogenase [Bombella saccharophila]